MRNSAIRLTLSLLLTTNVFAGFVPAAAAFECSRDDGDPSITLAWPRREVRWRLEQEVVDAFGPDALTEAQAAFDAWSGVDCSDFNFVYDGPVSNGVVAEADGINALIWLASEWPYDDMDTAIALTSVFYDGRNGVVSEADIEFNAANFNFLRLSLVCDASGPNMDFRNTLTHEVGHMIGLAHPPRTPEFAEATMYGAAARCETRKRTLAQDDIDGICFIYPEAAATRSCELAEAEPEGCRHVGRARRDIPWGAGLVFTGAIIFLWARRRRPGD